MKKRNGHPSAKGEMEPAASLYAWLTLNFSQRAIKPLHFTLQIKISLPLPYNPFITFILCTCFISSSKSDINFYF